MTGFPGFLGSALLPRLLERRAGATATCLVQDRYLDTARERLRQLTDEHPVLRDRVRLVVGDITAPGLGIEQADTDTVAEVEEVWHLAAVYDLATPQPIAHRVNVEGTQHVLDFCASHPELRRLHYVSTCYVSGRYNGEFAEDVLEAGQAFRNHYESTKHAAEVLVREAMERGLPATIYRPGIVVGDSTTGETQKYDGPYFLATFLRRQLPVAVVPAVGDLDTVRVCLVPRDFVIDAMDRLSVLDRSLGRTYALTDPQPPTARELVETFAAHLGRRVVWLPLPLWPTRLLVGHVPLMERALGLPAEALDYFASPTSYSTTNTSTDLEGTGLVCPSFADYAGPLLDFMTSHPEVDAKAMV
ncbi:SDR family oxidoreductase [Nocardioides ferulae]|uniref:SDR family oxidoreductase n=1 Tax=Nocardioides ferulae TaxID=2340821 RepID=UPI00198145D8|nr:SDR family oxidoreductase [Nocardioides ferulae]